MTAENRHSVISFVLLCLHIDGVPHFLLRHHRKWGDWSLAGGHVETEDAGSWAAAAAREVQEELSPLAHRKDFILVPIFSRPLTWGPVPSRSAENRPTTYEAQFFSMELLGDPLRAFSQMNVHDLRLVPQGDLEREALPTPLRTLKERLGGGLTSIPLGWSDSLRRSDLPKVLFEPIAA